MSRHQTETISGLLDGELQGVRRWMAERHVRACPICAAEYRRQRHVRRMLQANPSTDQMSDSADFFWSKVKAEIKGRGAKPAATRPASRSGCGSIHLLLATGATVAVAFLCMLWLNRTPARPAQSYSVSTSKLRKS